MKEEVMDSGAQGLGNLTPWEAEMKKKYPIFLRDLGCNDMMLTCMCFGLCIDDGWHAVFEDLCKKAEELNASPDYTLEVIADQVKEKYADLCVYWHVQNRDGSDCVELDTKEKTQYDDFYSKVRDIMIEYTGKANSICQFCGNPGEVVTVKGWIFCLCDECKEKQEHKNNWTGDK